MKHAVRTASYTGHWEVKEGEAKTLGMCPVIFPSTMSSYIDRSCIFVATSDEMMSVEKVFYSYLLDLSICILSGLDLSQETFFFKV